jgi:hypothetical protein
LTSGVKISVESQRSISEASVRMAGMREWSCTTKVEKCQQKKRVKEERGEDAYEAKLTVDGRGDDSVGRGGFEGAGEAVIICFGSD